MSESMHCICEGKLKDKIKNYRVVHRYHNHSYFQSPKGGEHHSRYSTVKCLKCKACGTTKASYVDILPDRFDILKNK